MILPAYEINGVNLGTSGIVLPGNKATFPDEYKNQTRLHYFARFFNSLEINSSFYKIPRHSTFEKWASEVPENFKFSAKLWRGITHVKNLAFSEEDVSTFMTTSAGLGAKRGCLLVQFPASLRVESLARVEHLLKLLTQFSPNNDWQIALEFRHPGWYQTAVYDVLTRFNASLVLHDVPNSTPPIALTDMLHPQCIYFRFHGPSGQYTGSYSNQAIEEYGERIQLARQKGQIVYVYFNNTIGSALQNAQYLQAQLRN